MSDVSALSDADLAQLYQRQQSPPSASQSDVPLRITVTPTPKAPSEMSDAELIAAHQNISRLRSAGEGFLDTASFGLRDEVKGLSEASGLPPWLGGFRAPVGGARVLYEKATGQPGEASNVYEATRNEQREFQREAEQHNPGSYLAGQIGGGVASTLAIPGNAAGVTMLGRAGAAARTGAIAGGAYGFGSGRGLEDSLSRGGLGTVVGGAVGGIASPAIDVARFGIDRLARSAPVQSVVNLVRSEANPNFIDDEAARRIVRAISTDMEARGSAWGPAEIAAADQAGLPRAVVDAGGERTLALARSAGNQSPEARAALEGVARPRFEDQGPRVAGIIRDMTGGVNATTQREQLEAAARQANRPAYRAAYEAGSGGLMSPELERLMSSPAVVEAMRAATTQGKNRAVAEGYGAFNSGVSISADGQVAFNRGQTGVRTFPDLQFWDYTYRALRDARDKAMRAGGGNEASALGTLATNLRNELDRLVPEFGTARAGAAAHFGAQDALEAGQNFVTSRGANAEGAAALARMSAPDRELFARGYASDLADRVLEARNSQNVLNQAFLTSPAARERHVIALGPQRAAQLEALLRAETVADRLRLAFGNSTTVRQLVEAGLAGAGGAIGGEGISGGQGHYLSAALALGAAFAAHRSNVAEQTIARRIGEMLASQDPAIIRRGVNVVAQTPWLMNTLRAVGDRVASVTAASSASRAAHPTNHPTE